MTFTTEVKAPPDVQFASLVANVVEDAGWRAQLDAPARRALANSAALGFEAIVRDAMTEDREAIRIVAACAPESLRISLFERGIPLDDAAARRDPQWKRIASGADEAHWRLHGKLGTELELIVARPHGLSTGDAAHAVRDEDVPPAPEQTYAIRRYEPGDGAGVARVFFLTYGYNYTFPSVYVPERLTQLNDADRYISIVAVAEDGEIAGHYALRRDEGTPIAEGCGAVVAPAHRGRDLLRQMRSAAEAQAQRLGLPAYYTQPVTGHGRTQSESEKFGAHACALTLGVSPAAMTAKHMEIGTRGQRQSLMLYFKALRSRERRTLYVPARHRDMVERIYANLELPVEVAAGGAAAAGPGDVRTSINRAHGTGTIAVQSAGASSASVLAQAAADLRALGRLGALYALLPLEDPATPALCEAAEACGFSFSGVGPWMLDGRDALRMQMPLTPIDTSLLTIVGEFGNDLLRYVQAQREAAA